MPSGLHLPVGALGGTVVFGEGLELQAVERVLPAADVLHRVLSPAAFTEETTGSGEDTRERRGTVCVCVCVLEWYSLCWRGGGEASLSTGNKRHYLSLK